MLSGCARLYCAVLACANPTQVQRSASISQSQYTGMDELLQDAESPRDVTFVCGIPNVGH